MVTSSQDLWTGSLELFIPAVAVPVLCWVWIAYRGTQASSWNAEPVEVAAVDFTSNAAGGLQGGTVLQVHIQQQFQRQLQGKDPCCKIVLGILLLAILVLYCLAAGPVGGVLGVLLCFGSAVSALWWTWARVGRAHGVELGLIARFFLQGGVLGVICAIMLELLESPFWSQMHKLCLTGHAFRWEGDNGAWLGKYYTFDMTLPCNIQDAANNILSPGLVEETFKAIWLLWTLRRSENELPASCCFCCPATRSTNCGSWFKLAPTPYHVILCALALGAGFESIENLEYVGGTGLMTGVMRLATSGMHVAWTGLVGVGVARRFFLPTEMRPSLLTVILPSILLHGIFDYSLSAIGHSSPTCPQGYPCPEKSGMAIMFFAIFLVDLIGSYVLIARATGGCGAPGFACECCCAPGFWERQFMGAAAAARQPQVTQYAVHQGPAYVGYATHVNEPLLSSAPSLNDLS